MKSFLSLFFEQARKCRYDEVSYCDALNDLHCCSTGKLHQIIEVVKVVRQVHLIAGKLFGRNILLESAMKGIDQCCYFTGKGYKVGGERKSTEIDLRLGFSDCVGKQVLFISYSRIFITLVRTIKSG